MRIGQRLATLVCGIHRTQCRPVRLLERSPLGTRRTHDVAWLVQPDTAPDMQLALCVEWQTRADPTMPRRIARYLIDLPVPEGTPVAAAVVYAVVPTAIERRGTFAIVGSGGMVSFEYNVIALPRVPWRQFIDPRWPVLALLVPAARDGTTLEALRASLRMVHQHFATHRESSAVFAFHYLLAELRSAREAWIMAASTEDIPFTPHEEPEGIWKWARERLEAEHMDGHARGLAEGRAEGRAQGVSKGRDALLSVVRGALDDATVRRVEAIEDLDVLAVAVRDALTR